MKAEHRHELHTNQLAEWLESTSDKVRPYSRAITGLLVAVAILLGVYTYVNSLERRSTAAASEGFVSALVNGRLEDLQAVAEDYRGTEPAAVAQLIAAESMLNEGSTQLFSNKADGRETVGRAADAFALAEGATKDPLLRAWALYGLGRAREARGELQRAQKDYETLLKEYPESALAEVARRHSQRLNEPAVKEFYDWFARQDPRPPVSDKEPGTPGLRPGFDLTEPLSPGEMRFPAPGESITPGLPTGDGSSALPAESPATGRPPEKSQD